MHEEDLSEMYPYLWMQLFGYLAKVIQLLLVSHRQLLATTAEVTPPFLEWPLGLGLGLV